MGIDVRTLVIILGFTHLMQVLVFFHQYKVNKAYEGTGWWLLWSAAEIIGFAVILLRGIPALLPVVIIVQNSMIIGGTIFLYIGVMRFLNRVVNVKILVGGVSVFFFALLYFLFINNNIQIRSAIISAALAITSLITAHVLFYHKTRHIRASANFLTVIFVVHGGIFIHRFVMIVAGTPVDQIFSPTLFSVLPFFDALIVSLLWTFGFIIMLNQRLNAEMAESREDMQQIFNTSPDAAIITRLVDGKIVDINEGYTAITGYTREEMIGRSSIGINIWKNIDDRNNVVGKLKEQGFCENYEAQFVLKDDREIIGLMSARLINLQGVPHIISITRDITQKKREEKERNLFNKVLEQSLDEIYIFDADTFRFVTVNKGALINLGYSLKELHMMTPLDLKPEFTLTTFEELIRPLIADKIQVLQFQTFHRRKDGSTYPVEVHLTMNQDDKLFLAIIMDVTIARKKEEELRLSADRFKNVFEHAAVGKSITDLDGSLMINQAFCDILGYAREELLQLKWQNITHPDDIERDTNMINAILRGHQAKARWIKRYIHKDGHIVWADLSTVLQRDERGKPLHFITTISDISAQILTQEKLRETNDYLENLFNYANAPIIVWDTSLKITRFNNAFEKLSGYSSKEVIGKEINKLFPQDKIDYSLENISKAIRGERWEVVEIEILRKDENIRTVLWNSANIFDREGNHIVATIAQGQDITDRKVAEEEIKQLNVDLENRVIERTSQLMAAYKELEAFSYSVSHDLRAPLRGVDGFTRILMDEYSPLLDEEGKRVCSVIRNSSQKMGQLIDNLLAFSRLNRAELQKSVIDMKTLVNSIYHEVTDAESRAKIEMKIGDLCEASGDPTMIRQVLANLLSNAVKFSSNKKRAEIVVTCKREEDKLVYCIGDNGAGFNMKYADKLFGVFQRLHNIKDYGGTGVGLAIVQRIIHRHGGEVWAEGVMDKGARFYFSLPVGSKE